MPEAGLTSPRRQGVDALDPRAWVAAALDAVADLRSLNHRAASAGPFRLVVRGEAVAPDALARSTPSAPAPPLEVTLVAADAIALPPPPMIRGHRVRFSEGSVEALLGADGLAWVLDRASATSCRVHWTGDVPDWEQVAPLRQLLTWWAGAHGQALVHAAAVRVNGVGILLTGPPGAGKSTLALACGAEGWDVLGDDYCVIERGAPPNVHALYGIAKADDASTALAGARVVPPRAAPLTVAGKRTMLLPRGDLTSATIGAVCALDAGHRAGPPQVREVQAIRAAGSLAPSTLAQQVGGWDATWRTIVEVVRSVRCVELSVGSDLGAAASLLRHAVAPG